MYSDVQCMVLIWLSRQEGHAQPPLDPSGSGLPEGFHCFPAHIWGTYGDHLPIPSNSINFAQYPSYPSFSLGDTVVCGLFCRFQLWCSVSRVETVVQHQLSKRKLPDLPVDPLLCQKDANMPAGAGGNALANWLHSMSCFPGRRSLGEIWGLESEPTPLGSCQGGRLQRLCQRDFG